MLIYLDMWNKGVRSCNHTFFGKKIKSMLSDSIENSDLHIMECVTLTLLFVILLIF